MDIGEFPRRALECGNGRAGVGIGSLDQYVGTIVGNGNQGRYVRERRNTEKVMVVCVRKIVLIGAGSGVSSDFVMVLFVVAEVRTPGDRFLMHASAGRSVPSSLERQHQHQDDEQNARHAREFINRYAVASVVAMIRSRDRTPTFKNITSLSSSFAELFWRF